MAWHSFCIKLLDLVLYSTISDISILMKLLDVYTFPHKYVSLLISIYLTLRLNTAVSKENFLLKKSPEGHASTTSISFLLGKVFLYTEIYFTSNFNSSFLSFLALNGT